MDTRRILAELRAERSRIDQAIAAIEAIGVNARIGRGRRRTATTLAPGAARPRRRHRISAAGRKRLSEMMKQRWAERRKKQKSA